jgi:phospholipid-translocating ATPase
MAKRRAGFAAWYDTVANFKVESLFTRHRGPGAPRTIFVNQNLPNDYFDPKGRPKKEHIFPTNQVISSKYTIITFLPRNLLEQFRRIANMYVSITCTVPSRFTN